MMKINIKKLEASCWWDLSEKQLKTLLPHFRTSEIDIEVFIKRIESMRTTTEAES